jgi:hypothetical protein
LKLDIPPHTLEDNWISLFVSIISNSAINMLSSVSRSVLRQARPQFRVQSLSQLQRLLSTLAVLEQNNGKLNTGSLSAVTAAQKLGGSVTAFVAGGSIKSVAEEAAKVEGVEKVVSVDNAAYDRVCGHLCDGRQIYNYGC